jgi:predicted membrane protein
MNQDWEQRRQERAQRRQARWEQRWTGGPCGGKPFGGVLFGLLLIGGGLLFLLRNLGIVYFDNVGQFWPVILIVIGGSKLVSPRGVHEVTTGLIMGGIGTLFLLRNLGFLYGNVWGYIWPAFFIAVGISMLMRNVYGPSWRGAAIRTEPMGDMGGTDANSIYADVVFGGIERKIVSQAFEGGKVSVVFGGAKIDLRGAGMQKPEIVLHADAAFGGVEIWAPDTWQVDVRGAGVFGGYEDRTHHPAYPAASSGTATNARPKLIVKGGAVFGGVTVRN